MSLFSCFHRLQNSYKTKTSSLCTLSLFSPLLGHCTISEPVEFTLKSTISEPVEFTLKSSTTSSAQYTFCIQKMKGLRSSSGTAHSPVDEGLHGEGPMAW